jgi:hypothetical protein
MLYVYISYRVYTSEDEAERLKKDTIRIVQRADKIMDKNAMKQKQTIQVLLIALHVRELSY